MLKSRPVSINSYSPESNLVSMSNISAISESRMIFDSNSASASGSNSNNSSCNISQDQDKNMASLYKSSSSNRLNKVYDVRRLLVLLFVIFSVICIAIILNMKNYNVVQPLLRRPISLNIHNNNNNKRNNFMISSTARKME